MLDNVDINVKDPNNNNALHYAALSENPEVIIELVKAKCDINAQSKSGDTPLHYAASEGHAKNVEALLRLGANPDITNVTGQTPLHLASQEGKTKAVEALLRNPGLHKLVDNVDTRYNNTALHHATLNGHKNTVKFLIDSGAKIDEQDSYGNTALHLAVILDQVDVLKTLLESKADPNLQNKHGDTPLHIAILKDNRESVRVLNNANTNVDIKNKNGETAAFLMEHKISQITLIEDIKNSLPASESKRRLDADPGNEGPLNKKLRAAQLGGAVAPHQRS